MCISFLHVVAVPTHDFLFHARGLQVEWVQASDPSKGFKYLYLSDADYRALKQGAGSATLRAQPLQAEGQQRWQLTDVVGSEDGLGVECLSGSGAIARCAQGFMVGRPLLLLMLGGQGLGCGWLD